MFIYECPVEKGIMSHGDPIVRQGQKKSNFAWFFGLDDSNEIECDKD